MKIRLGVSAGLNNPVLDQLPSRIKRISLWLAIKYHLLITRIHRILPINHSGHPKHRFLKLIFGDHIVVQPVSNVLARDSECCSVFHQSHVVDVGYFRAANTLVDPAHHIAQHALHIVIELSLDFFDGQVTAVAQWNREYVVDATTLDSLKLSLNLAYGHVVIVRCVKRRGGR